MRCKGAANTLTVAGPVSSHAKAIITDDFSAHDTSHRGTNHPPKSQNSWKLSQRLSTLKRLLRRQFQAIGRLQAAGDIDPAGLVLLWAARCHLDGTHDIAQAAAIGP